MKKLLFEGLVLQKIQDEKGIYMVELLTVLHHTHPYKICEMNCKTFLSQIFLKPNDTFHQNKKWPIRCQNKVDKIWTYELLVQYCAFHSSMSAHKKVNEKNCNATVTNLNKTFSSNVDIISNILEKNEGNWGKLDKLRRMMAKAWNCNKTAKNPNVYTVISAAIFPILYIKWCTQKRMHFFLHSSRMH